MLLCSSCVLVLTIGGTAAEQVFLRVRSRGLHPGPRRRGRDAVCEHPSEPHGNSKCEEGCEDSRKGRGKKAEISDQPEVSFPSSAGVRGLAPPHTATSQIGNADIGDSLVCNAPAAAEQTPLSALDENALPPRVLPHHGTKRKVRASRPRTTAASSAS
jgi:hypothetical protein